MPLQSRRMGSKRMRTSDHGPAQAAATYNHRVGATFDVPGARTSPACTRRHIQHCPMPWPPSGTEISLTGTHAAGAGLTLTDHMFTVPLDHTGAAPGEQELFAREVVAHGRAKLQLPYLLFLQGTLSTHISASFVKPPARHA